MLRLVALLLVVGCRGSDPRPTETRIVAGDAAGPVAADAPPSVGSSTFELESGFGAGGVLDCDELAELSAPPAPHEFRDTPAYHRLTPVVRILRPAVEGELLDPFEVRDAVDAGALLRCYERALVARPELGAPVKVHFTITATGQVTGAAIAGSGGRALDRCALDAIRRVTVERHAAIPTPVAVTEAIVFARQ